MFKWEKCPKCQVTAEIPSVLEKYAVVIHTDHALSITYECPNCGVYLTAHISYQIIELVTE